MHRYIINALASNGMLSINKLRRTLFWFAARRNIADRPFHSWCCYSMLGIQLKFIFVSWIKYFRCDFQCLSLMAPHALCCDRKLFIIRFNARTNRNSASNCSYANMIMHLFSFFSMFFFCLVSSVSHKSSPRFVVIFTYNIWYYI